MRSCIENWEGRGASSCGCGCTILKRRCFAVIAIHRFTYCRPLGCFALLTLKRQASCFQSSDIRHAACVFCHRCQMHSGNAIEETPPPRPFRVEHLRRTLPRIWFDDRLQTLPPSQTQRLYHTFASEHFRVQHPCRPATDAAPSSRLHPPNRQHRAPSTHHPRRPITGATPSSRAPPAESSTTRGRSFVAGCTPAAAPTPRGSPPCRPARPLPPAHKSSYTCRICVQLN